MKRYKFISIKTRKNEEKSLYLLQVKYASTMNFIYLEDYPKHPDAKINPALLGEYDLSDFDFQQMRNIVVQRVIEKGWPSDWWAALNLYGESGVKEAIKVIPYMNDMDMNFASKAFEIPFSEMNCYKEKQLHPVHWDSSAFRKEATEGFFFPK